MMHSGKKSMRLLLLASLMGSTLLWAAPTAKEVVQKAREYRDSLKRYAFTATMGEELLDEKGEWKTYTQKVEVKVERPDKLRVDVKSEEKDRTSYLKDGVFTMVDHRFGYFGQIKTPKEIDKALDFIFFKYGINAPLAGLVYTKMGKRVHFSKSKYFGIRKLSGVACDYVAFSNSKKELHLWITRGDEPVVRSFVLIDRTLKKRPRTEAFITWDTHPRFSESVFTFTPTKDLAAISVVSAQ
jgi:hypothetical protein